METASSQRILARIDALARALEAAGVPVAARARLLESASVAAYHALTLEELAADGETQRRARPERRPAAAPLVVRELAA